MLLDRHQEDKRFWLTSLFLDRLDLKGLSSEDKVTALDEAAQSFKPGVLR